MADINALLKLIDHEILTKEEEIRLGNIIQSVSTSPSEKQLAINKLVIKNIYLVLKFAHSYKRKEFEFEDIVNYGIVGLFTAAEKFDPKSYTNRFASYARHWIKESIMKAIREYSGLPKIPVYLVKNLWNVTRILAQQVTDCDDITLAKLAGISEDNAKYLRTLLFKSIQFENVHSGIEEITPEEIYIKKERTNLILQQLKEILTKNEFCVIVHTFGFEVYGYNKMSFDEITTCYNIKSPQHLKSTAIKKLKNSKVLKLLYEEE